MAVLQEVRKTIPEAAAVRHLTSGDIRVYVTTAGVKETIIKKKDALGERLGAPILRQDFPVKILGVPTQGFEIKKGRNADSSALLSEIQKSTGKHVPDVEITRIENSQSETDTTMSATEDTATHTTPPNNATESMETHTHPQRLRTHGSLIYIQRLRTPNSSGSETPSLQSVYQKKKQTANEKRRALQFYTEQVRRQQLEEAPKTSSGIEGIPIPNLYPGKIRNPRKRTAMETPWEEPRGRSGGPTFQAVAAQDPSQARITIDS
ncbi:hypothetical protein GQ43DRAFT_435186 [Delitschia confertaspora ATCC 74209]|uniref:Uncharacterized protein n=1 Tax=Delitschia confertaspora ATCC 74209 TaxID=1513339 RepID=A0A9P4JDE6_9PLEO|nr:hypothetical protein GQ43DRAFT_435186 [Delitschia confertaspora ATCC 74209]